MIASLAAEPTHCPSAPQLMLPWFHLMMFKPIRLKLALRCGPLL